ncbi:MAG TPA: right-handed parallel beta-helix repeat-containing protein [Pyrinomonadaceae bacterium]|jgi:hypothetical protein
MTKLRITINSLTLCLLLLAATSIANAQATRSWVSGVGDDANPCSRTAPCKTFAGAISKTATTGEISVLDPGGFGAVTITKSITINGQGSLGGITAAGVNGVVINGLATSNIYLKNLDINGAGTGLDGIRFLAGNSLVVENVKIYNFTGTGIIVNKVNSTGFLSVADSKIINCSAGGITTQTSGGGFVIRAEIDNTKIFGCQNGFRAGTQSQMAVKNSTASGCGSAGFLADTSTSVLNMDSCVATQNANGVKASNAGLIRVGQSTVANNITKGLDKSVGAGVIESYQDNYIRGNPASDAPTNVLRS